MPWSKVKPIYFLFSVHLRITWSLSKNVSLSLTTAVPFLCCIKDELSWFILGLGPRHTHRHGGCPGRSPARTTPEELCPEALLLARLGILERRIHLPIFPTMDVYVTVPSRSGWVIEAKMKFYSTSKFYGNFVFQTVKFWFYKISSKIKFNIQFLIKMPTTKVKD